MLDLFTNAISLIEKFVPDADKKIELKQALLEAQSQAIEASAKAVIAEAQGESWLQRNWRPITMTTFLVLIVLDSFDLLTHQLPHEVWTLLDIGLGGYVVGRSAEKVASHIKHLKGK